MAEYMEEQDQDLNGYADYDFDDDDDYDDYDDDRGYDGCEDGLDESSDNSNATTTNDYIQSSPSMVRPPAKSVKILLPDLVQLILYYIPFARLDGKLYGRPLRQIHRFLYTRFF